MNSDGDVDFTSIRNFDSNLNWNIHTTPTVTALLDGDWEGDPSKSTRLIFSEKFPTTHTSPLVRYVRSTSNTYTSFFIDTYGSYISRCLNGSCSSTTYLDSHVAVSTAWDQISNSTILSRPRTNPDYSSGYVYLYPGIYPGTINHVRQGNFLGSSDKPADGYDLWSYEHKTDFPVGVACAPSQTGIEYNCLLAWQDRGVPNGSVLYKYFRVSPITHQIEWRPGPSTVRSSAKAQSGVSAAYFNDAFWLVWKEPASGGGNVVHTKTTSPSCYTCWSSPVVLTGAANIADPPTWMYVPSQNQESIVLWTQAD